MRGAQTIQRALAPATALIALVLGFGAVAQADAGGNGVAVGGTVSSEIALSVGTPGPFLRVAGTDRYEIKIPVKVTSTGSVTQLSAGFSLSASTQPVLFSWNQPLAQSPVVVAVSQRLTQGSIASGSLHKLVLITVSTQEP